MERILFLIEGLLKLQEINIPKWLGSVFTVRLRGTCFMPVMHGKYLV